MIAAAKSMPLVEALGIAWLCAAGYKIAERRAAVRERRADRERQRASQGRLR